MAVTNLEQSWSIKLESMMSGCFENQRSRCSLHVGLLLAFFSTVRLSSAAGFDCRLRVTLQPEWDGNPLVLGAPALTNGAGQIFSVTRLDLFVSDFSLHQEQGGWLAPAGGEAFVSFGKGRTQFDVDKLAARDYDRLRFNVGLRPAINHSHPDNYPEDHPLNVNLNGMHLERPERYLFFIIGGQWQRGNESIDYSLNLEMDKLLTTVELPVPLKLRRSQPVYVNINLKRLFQSVIPGGFSTNSLNPARPTSEIMQSRLRASLPLAFSISPGPLETPYGIYGTTPYVFKLPQSFPAPALPKDNPITVEGVRLGRRLFGERMLSVNGRQSCASCHHPEQAFSEEGHRFSIGAEGGVGERNSMPIFNMAWKSSFFWDGRAGSLREQVLQPIQNPIEMHETLPRAVAKLSRDELYPEFFERVFGPGQITAEKISKALEQFLLTVVSVDSKFDRARQGADKLTAEEERGFQLFSTDCEPARGQKGANCFHCHGGPTFRSRDFANNGLDTVFKDLGRYSVTKKEMDKGKFSVPSLRNIEITRPYMHDGRFATLEEVVDHYATGIKVSQTLDEDIAGRGRGGVPLSLEDKRALVAFLRTLTDERFSFSLRRRPFDAAFRQ